MGCFRFWCGCLQKKGSSWQMILSSFRLCVCWFAPKSLEKGFLSTFITLLALTSPTSLSFTTTFLVKNPQPILCPWRHNVECWIPLAKGANESAGNIYILPPKTKWRKKQLQIVSTISLDWSPDYGKTFTIIHRYNMTKYITFTVKLPINEYLIEIPHKYALRTYFLIMLKMFAKITSLLNSTLNCSTG